MEPQHCKVGTVTALSAMANAVTVLETQYQNFMDKANAYSDTHLVEFFEAKALKIRKILEKLVS